MNPVTFLVVNRRKIILLIAGITSFIFFGFFFPIILSSTNDPLRLLRPKSSEETTTPTREPLSMRGIDIITQILASTDHFAQTNNQYYTTMLCTNSTGTGTCTFLPAQPGFIPYIVPFLDRLTNMTSETLYTARADGLFNQAKQECAVDFNRCDVNFWAFVDRFEKTQDTSLKQLTATIGQKIIQNPTNDTPAQLVDIQKLLRVHQVTDDSIYLITAQSRLSKFIQREDSDTNPIDTRGPDGQPIRRYTCAKDWLGFEASTFSHDFRAIDQERAFLSTSASIVSKLGTLDAALFCLEGVHAFARLSRNSRWQDGEKAILSTILHDYWDMAQNKLFTADNGLVHYNASVDTQYSHQNEKRVEEMMWFLYHLASYPKSTFTF